MESKSSMFGRIFWTGLFLWIAFCGYVVFFADPLKMGDPFDQHFGGGRSAGAGENGRVHVRSLWRWDLTGYLWAVSTDPYPAFDPYPRRREELKEGAVVRSICPGDPLCLTFLVVVEEPKEE